ncbi:MAG: LysR family transcriptional regulator [Proteobacteria bacterium]|nr:LysR family transcriptional regulator [Pseudomonadota bacterium]
MSDIDLNNIRRLDGGLLLVFRGLLRRRRTTAVAKDLGLSQSAVSHALTRLRDIFADPLFIRRPHGLEPTRRALELGPRIEALLDRMGETLQRDTAFNPAQSRRRFLISAPEFVTALIGADLVNAFRARAAQASFVINFLTPDRALVALRRGEIDLALGRFESTPPDLRAESLYRDRYCVTARRGHPKLKGRISLAQYNAIGHVFAQSESEMDRAENADTPDIAFTAVVPRWLTVLAIVAASDAIATCPRRLVERQAKLMGLQVLNPPFVPNEIEVKAVRRAGIEDAGLDWLREEIKVAVG